MIPKRRKGLVAAISWWDTLYGATYQADSPVSQKKWIVLRTLLRTLGEEKLHTEMRKFFLTTANPAQATPSRFYAKVLKAQVRNPVLGTKSNVVSRQSLPGSSDFNQEDES